MMPKRKFILFGYFIVASVVQQILTGDVTSFEVAIGETNLVKLAEGSNATLNLVYESTDTNTYNLGASIDTGTVLNTASAAISSSQKTIQYVIDPSFLSNDGFGTYLLNLTLNPQSSGTGLSKAVVIFYEEPIEGFQISRDPYVPLDEEIFFAATFTKGSNVETEWFLDTNDTCLLQHNGTGARVYNLNFTFTVPGQHNVTVVAANTVTRTFHSMLVEAFYKLNGISIATSNGPVGTNENANFTVTLTSGANLPQGTIKVNMSYGDGGEDIVDLSSETSSMQNEGYVFNHQYTSQGNFSVSATFYTEVDNMTSTLTVQVWDKLTVSLSSVFYAGVGENITFDFVNTPTSNFQYSIDYGDSSPKYENDASDLNNSYSFTAWSRSYSTPGVYNVTMIAWNPFYVSVCTYEIIIQYPLIPANITLTPQNDEIPTPDGIVNFTLILVDDMPSPTDVNCTFDFGDGNSDVNISTVIVYNTPFVNVHNYSTASTFSVSVTCQNYVSTMQKTATIIVRTFTVTDFVVTYESPLAMNMSTTPYQPTNEYPHTLKAVSENATAAFVVSLFSCTRMPPGIQMTWNFGDGNIETVSQTSFEKNHLYTERQTYSVSVFINDTIQGGNTTKSYSIQVGIVTLTPDKYSGIVGSDSFTLTASGMSGSPTYTFDVDSTDSVTNPSSSQASVTYTKYGTYLPKVTANNGTITEIVYLTQPLKLDFDISNLKVSLSNDTVNLPPGDVTFYIEAEGAGFYPSVVCDLKTGDEIDDTTYNEKQNISSNNSMSITAKYLTLGNHSLSVNCSNYASNFVYNSFVEARNPCFTKDGIFDRQYSSPDSPMKAYTSVDVSLSSRMGVICLNKEAGFQWEVESENGTNNFVPHEYVNPIQPPKGKMTFSQGKIQQGKYRISLNVSLDGTWIKERTYLLFVKPEPYAYIVGGTKKTARIIDKQVELNALDESYDAELGVGGNGNLLFDWNCKHINTDQFNQMEEVVQANYEHNSYSVHDCSLEDISRGKKMLNVTTSSKGFVVTVTVGDGSKNKNFTQYLRILPGDPPQVKVECKINCKTKFAITSKMNMLATCTDCASDEIPNYSWSLQKSVSGSLQDVQGFDDMTTTGINSQSIALKENVLEAGQKYALKLQVSSPVRNGSSEFIKDIITNYPPYNGKCTPSPIIGIALEDKFEVVCEGWTDEGDEENRDATRDLRAGEPLTYLYETITQRNLSTGIENDTNEIYKGGESTVINMPLKLGDESFNYSVTVKVYIFDRIGDFSTSENIIQVRPMPNVVPTSSNDTAAIEKLFDNFNDTFAIANASGNSMAVVRLVNSVGSYFTDVEDSATASTPSTQEILDGTATSVPEASEPSPVVKLYQEKAKELTNILSTAVTVSKQFSASDVQQISGTLETVTKNPQYITDESATKSANIMGTMMESVLNTTKKKPFPVEDLKSLTDSMSSTLKVLDSIFTTMIPNQVGDLDNPDTEDSIYQELKEAEDRKRTQFEQYGTPFNVTSDEELRRKAKLMYKIRSREYEEQKKQADFAKQNVGTIEKSLEDMKAAMLLTQELGEGRSLRSKGGVFVSTEIVTLRKLLNRTEELVDDIQLEFDNNGTDSNNDTILNVKVGVLEKNLYQGTGASTVTSSVASVEVSGDIQPQVKIKNKQTSVYQNHMPIMREDDPEKMVYITFDMKNDDDSVIIYLKPDNFSISSETNPKLYTVYLRNIDFPKADTGLYDFSKVLSIRDWDTYGFKVFINQGKCTKGKCYLGFKPMESQDLSSYATRSRKKRSILATTPGYNSSALFSPANANFSLMIVTTGCRTWDGNAWISKGCLALSLSTVNETVCRCPKRATGNLFASTFYVPPNTIDFSTVFSKFDLTNAAVYGTVIALLTVYIIAAVLLRRQDRKDLERWATHFLCDSENTDEYFYLLTVHTGLRRGAGTKSVVNFVLAGDEEDSGVRLLSDGINEGFETSSVRKFFMGTKNSLGDLTYLRIWHDSSGSGDSSNWYLNKVIVDDPQRNKRYVFLCDRWLALDQDDGRVERILPVCGKDNLLAFNTLFAQHAQFNITENHLWLSLIIRPERSTFTRLQRVSCLLALLFLTMIANAMFFQSSDDTVDPNEVQIGFIRFSLSTVYISFIGILLTTPPIVFVTLVFKKCKPKYTFSKTNQKLESKLNSNIKTALQNEQTENKQSKTFNYEDFYSTKHLPLPHWMSYIAWVVVFLAVLTSAFFLILYSMEWGKSKSEEWLSCFFFSFFESLIFVDPLKVILIAVLFAILFKKPVDADIPSINLDKLKSAASEYNSESQRSYMAFVNGIFCKTEPPPQSDLDILREKRKQELRAQKAVITLIMYAIFVFVIYSISYIERDQRSFNLKNNVQNYIYSHGYGQFGFSAVNSTKDFTDWMSTTFIPTYYPQTYPNGTTLSATDKEWFGDLTNVRVGPGRLRQVRMNKGTCDYSKLTWPYYCVENYNVHQEDDTFYCLGWKPYNHSVCGTELYRSAHITANAWKFTKSIDIWGLPITGEYNTYGGGGYLLKFTKDKVTAERMMNELKTYNWIDRGTRAVFVEFTLYNANTNLFTYVSFIAEFTELGGAFTWTETFTFRPVVSLGALGTYAVICYAIFIVYQIITTVQTVQGIRNLGCCGFSKIVWNSVDTACLILGYIAIAIFIVRSIYANMAMSKFYDSKVSDPNAFINFNHIVIWDYTFNVIIAILVFISTLRILRILGYNKRLTEIISVISNAAPEIIGFGIVFSIIFSAYVLFGYLLFGHTLKEYKSVFSSWGSLTNALIGKNSLDSMIRAAPQFAQFFYFTYVFCVLFSLITMFAAILNKSIMEVRIEAANQGDTYGIVDMLTKSLRSVMGIAIKRNGNKEITANARKKYMEVIGKSPQIDAPNILRLVRGTFLDYSDKEKQEDNGQLKQTDQDLLLDRLITSPPPPSRMSKYSRAETPRDIMFSLDNDDRQKTGLQNDFLL